MKTLFSAVFIFIVLVVAGVVIKNTGKQEQAPISEAPKDVNPGGDERCFIWNTEAGDSATLKISIKDDNASGYFKWLPAQKDSKTGSFVGKVTSAGAGSTVDAWWQASSEGMIVNEEMKIKIENNIANVGFGAMKDRGDGTYVYLDPSLISWEPNLIETDCSDEAVR